MSKRLTAFAIQYFTVVEADGDNTIWHGPMRYFRVDKLTGRVISSESVSVGSKKVIHKDDMYEGEVVHRFRPYAHAA